MSERRTLIVTAVVSILIASYSASWVLARFMMPDLEQIPVEKLIENIETKLAADPGNSVLHMNLGRVYAMSFANKNAEFKVLNDEHMGKDDSANWFGHVPAHVPFARYKRRDEPDDKAMANLERAVKHFRKAIELDEDNLTAMLSLAWCQEQAGDNMESIEAYREIVEKGWEKEKDQTRFGIKFRSIVLEAASYLKPRLDSVDDADEIAELDRRIAAIKRIPRPITPIAIPLGPNVDFESVNAPHLTVAFDADGSGTVGNWTWIQPGAGWLVYDQKGKGQISSALQMFGNVTFWCFWDNGYDAMKSLDENNDQFLSGDELRYLAIWQDANSNGISERGEVLSLEEHGIIGLRCVADAKYVVSQPGHPAVLGSNTGVFFRGGKMVPSYDVILHRQPVGDIIEPER